MSETDVNGAEPHGTTPNDGSGSNVDLSEGARGIVVMPTANLAPIGDDDFPSGLPPTPQDAAPSSNGGPPAGSGDEGE